MAKLHENAPWNAHAQYSNARAFHQLDTELQLCRALRRAPEKIISLMSQVLSKYSSTASFEHVETLGSGSDVILPLMIPALPSCGAGPVQNQSGLDPSGRLV